MKEFFRKIFYPLPKDQKEPIFKPNYYIKFLRLISILIQKMLFLNGKNRFSNEFIQMLNPIYEFKLHNKIIKFRTGHGRLLWRAKEFLNEEPLTIEWINSFNTNDIFYDIGANVGNYTIYAGIKGIKTFAFEPEILNLAIMYENIFMNNLNNICTIIPIGLHNLTGIECFFLKNISKGDANHTIGRKSPFLEKYNINFKTINTITCTLSDIVKFLNLPLPTKVKIDVDGNELKVIQGGIDILKNADEILVELDLSFNEHVEAKSILEQFFYIKNKKRDFRQSLFNNIIIFLKGWYNGHYKTFRG
jgi:FkbM family methyltransferase